MRAKETRYLSAKLRYDKNLPTKRWKKRKKGEKKRKKGKEIKSYQASLHAIGLDHDEGKLGSHGCQSREVRRRRCKGNERERETHTHTHTQSSVVT
jgi:hypothetical protein